MSQKVHPKQAPPEDYRIQEIGGSYKLLFVWGSSDKTKMILPLGILYMSSQIMTVQFPKSQFSLQLGWPAQKPGSTRDRHEHADPEPQNSMKEP